GRSYNRTWLTQIGAETTSLTCARFPRTTVSMLSRKRSASRAAAWNASDPSKRAASVDSIVSLDCRTPGPRARSDARRAPLLGRRKAQSEFAQGSTYTSSTRQLLPLPSGVSWIRADVEPSSGRSRLNPPLELTEELGAQGPPGVNVS